MPHLSETLWHMLGCEGLASAAAWPVSDPALLVNDEVTIVVQINGKKRGELKLAKDMDKAAVEKTALSADFVAEHIKDKTLRRVIVVPNKIVNIVV